MSTTKIRLINPDKDATILRASLCEKDAARLDLCLMAMTQQDAFILVPEKNGKPAGLGVVHVRARNDMGWDLQGTTLGYLQSGDAYLENIDIDKSLRNQEVGTRLLQALEAETFRRGISRIWLHTGEDNSGAQRFFGRNGWQHKETVQVSWKPVGRLSRVYCKNVSDYSP